ncbi:hypothetical protein TNCV_2978181 [Trichonephila clavipes]|nr:hypothetical protein TNCV_2978181 [Trichonephila clavipes]
MKIHRLGSGSNLQPWVQKAIAELTTPPNFADRKSIANSKNVAKMLASLLLLFLYRLGGVGGLSLAFCPQGCGAHLAWVPSAKLNSKVLFRSSEFRAGGNWTSKSLVAIDIAYLVPK